MNQKHIFLFCSLAMISALCLCMLTGGKPSSAADGKRCVIDYTMFKTAVNSTSGAKRLVVTTAVPAGTVKASYFLNSEQSAKLYYIQDTLYLAPVNSGDILAVEGKHKGMFSPYDVYTGKGLETLQEIDLRGLDTSLVTSSLAWFSGHDNLTKVDIRGLDFSSCTDMSEMFVDSPKLKTIEVNWEKANTQKNKSLRLFFRGCSSLQSTDINGMDTASVEDMTSMYEGCQCMTSVNFENCDFTSLLYVQGMFSQTGLTSFSFDHFDVSNVKDFSSLFSYCENLQSIDFSHANTKKGSKFRYTFSGCKSLQSIDLTGLNTSGAVDMEGMFYECSGLTYLDARPLQTASVSNMKLMFFGCTALKGIDVSSFNTVSVTDMGGMFSECTSLLELDLSNFVTGQVEVLGHMFRECKSLREVNLSSFNTSKAYCMDSMFEECDSLVNVDLSNFTCESLVDPSAMFWDCDKLETVNLSGFRTIYNIFSHNIYSLNFNFMFYACPKLSHVDLSNMVIDETNKSYSMILRDMFGTPGVMADTAAKLYVCTASNEMSAILGSESSTITFYSHPACVNGKCPLCGKCQNLIQGSTHSYKNGVCTVCGICKGIAETGKHKYTNGACEYCAVPDPAISKNSLVGYSITLTDNIGLNVYFNLSEELRNRADTWVYFTLPDGSKQMSYIGNSKQELNGSEYVYGFTCTVPARMVDETISFYLQNKSMGYTSPTYTQSVKGYAQVLATGNYDSETKQLAKALTTYGAYAKRYFSDDSYAIPSDSMIITLPSSENVINGLKDYSASISRKTDSDSLRFTGCSLILRDSVSVRYYFVSENRYLTEEEMARTKFEWVDTDWSTMTTYYYYESPGCNVADWGVMGHTADPEFSVKYCPLNYIHDAMCQYTQGSLYDLLRSMYAYYAAAQAYQNR